MSEATGTFHLSHPRLYGPAERTLIEPWLTELSHQTMNAYTEAYTQAHPQAHTEADVEAHGEATPAVLAVVETLPAPLPVAGRRTGLATAA